MAFRTFLDRAGNEWLAFDVVPREEERRHYDRRSLTGPQDDVTGDDRRDERDRRLTVGGGGMLGSSQGWLAFEHGDERRRLSPIPVGWEKSSDQELDGYREAAQPVHIEAPTLADVAVRHS